MAQLGQRTLADTAQQHVDDHNQLHSKANYLFDVRDFGAVGDESTDDTAAIQAAIDAAGAVTSGAKVVIPPGTYLHSGLTISDNAVEIAGVGRNLAAKLRYTGAGTAINIAAQARITIRDLAILHNGSGDYGIVHAYVGSITGGRLQIQNVEILNFGTSGLYCTNTESSYFQDLVVSGSGSYGIHIDNTNHTGSALGINNTWINCRSISNTGPGWYIEDQAASEFINCQALQNASPQFRLVGSSRNCHIRGLDVEKDNTGIGLHVGGIEHDVSVDCFGLDVGVYVEGDRCAVRASKFSSVTTDIELTGLADSNLIEDYGDTVLDAGTNTVRIGQSTKLGPNVGFYGTTPIAQPTGVAVSAAGIHAALVDLGLITA